MSASDPQQSGPEYWRSLKELAGSDDFQKAVHNEFPAGYFDGADPVNRRDFWKLIGASLALTGLSGCTKQPLEKIVPYVEQPEQIVPGKPLFYATAMPFAGSAIGLLVESHMGRPTKVEGNPRHPASLGATDAFAQASILGLYDPDRSQVVTRNGRISSYVAFLENVNGVLDLQRAVKGRGLRFLTQTVTSPTLARQIQGLLAEFPEAKWHQYEPATRDAARAGAKLAFGQYAGTHYRLDKADVILALDSDFLTSGPGAVRYARDFANRRRSRPNRLYAVESTPTSTGSTADHRLPLRASEIEGFARSVAKGLGIAVETGTSAAPEKWVRAVAADLAKHKGSSLVVAGDAQPPVVHALAHAMNHALGNNGQTAIQTAPVEANPVDEMQSLRELAADMDAGRVDLLVILNGNPVYNAPADLKFGERLLKAKFRVHLSLYQDETSSLCQWHVPETHFLESWSDTRSHDGTVSIVQPLIAPLYGGKSVHEFLATMARQPDRTSYDLIRETWKSQWPAAQFERSWRAALHEGLIPGSALPPKSFPIAASFPAPAAAPDRSIEVIFRPDPTVWDGRFSNNGWLQELPKPLSKLTWDNAAMMSPATAAGLRVANEDLVELEYEGRKIKAPVWMMPGHPDDSVTVHLGYGRTRAGKAGTGAGFNGYALRTSAAPWIGARLGVRPIGGRYRLSTTQEHHAMEGRHPVRAGTVEEFRKEPEFVQKMGEAPPRGLTMYPEHKYEGYSWGMAVDLSACNGCSACVVACQAENNIPVVGKEEVGHGREMHWIRIDRYYEGNEHDPKTYHQPVMCVQCEDAPCEVVCPVGATVHSSEGLNEMVYNRCVGTRYCSNNCPYKVRRFNFLQYSDYDTEVFKLLRNPDVTVRTRGVMEKCTYCVQRINGARIQSKKENRDIRDGEFATACEAACPTQAIVFGNINDPNSRVSKLKKSPLNYGLLEELNTRPRTTHLAKLTNPNPELEAD